MSARIQTLDWLNGEIDHNEARIAGLKTTIGWIKAERDGEKKRAEGLFNTNCTLQQRIAELEARPIPEADQRIDWVLDRALKFEDEARVRQMVLEQQLAAQQSLKESISMSRDRLTERVAALEAIHCEVHEGEPTAEQPCPCCAAVRVAELEAKLGPAETIIRDLIAKLAEVGTCSTVLLNGAEERTRIALDFKNQWMARAVAAEAALREAQTRYELAESILLGAPQGPAHNTISGLWLAESYRPWWIGRLRSTALAPQAPEKCPKCGGSGFITKYACVTTRLIPCPACLGGKVRP